ncbi:MAG: helix-turn-helix domain-containing protein [Caulobacteraceae bacterium]
MSNLVFPELRAVPRLTLTIREAALSTGISRSKLYERIAEGDLVSFKSCGRRLVRLEALQLMLANDEAREQARRDNPAIGAP